jgi:hypothetical protein
MNANDWKKLSIYMKSLLIFLIILLVISATILNGYTITILWSWFIIPIFNTIPLTIAQGIGLQLFIMYTTMIRQKPTEQTEFKIGEVILYLVAKPMFALLFGYVVLYFGS